MLGSAASLFDLRIPQQDWNNVDHHGRVEVHIVQKFRCRHPKIPPKICMALLDQQALPFQGLYAEESAEFDPFLPW